MSSSRVVAILDSVRIVSVTSEDRSNTIYVKEHLDDHTDSMGTRTERWIKPEALSGSSRMMAEHIEHLTRRIEGSEAWGLPLNDEEAYERLRKENKELRRMVDMLDRRLRETAAQMQDELREMVERLAARSCTEAAIDSGSG